MLKPKQRSSSMSTLRITDGLETNPVVQSFPKRLSRRALMKAAAIAPVLAAARQAWADPTTKNTLEFMRVAPMPADDVKYVRETSTGDVPNVNPDRIEVVWRVLWAHFQLGLGGVSVAEGFSLTQTAYIEKIAEGSNTKTGARIAENVKLENFDPLGNDYQTNVCAYICAHKAALLACAAQSKTVTAEIYKRARQQTWEEMTGKLDCARKSSQAKGTAFSSPGLGFGC
jgi:hypothetical protein